MGGTGLPPQPKRFALLVYLAITAPRGFVRRDRIVALFWAELDHEHARANLRKALSFLRRSLGPDVMVTRGQEEVGVDREVLWCDVVQCIDPSEAAPPSRADTGEGNFLDGFHFDGAPEEWYGWVETVERQLDNMASSGQAAPKADAMPADRPMEIATPGAELMPDPITRPNARVPLRRVPPGEEELGSSGDHEGSCAPNEVPAVRLLNCVSAPLQSTSRILSRRGSPHLNRDRRRVHREDATGRDHGESEDGGDGRACWSRRNVRQTLGRGASSCCNLRVTRILAA